jgi:YidC/Oxa1 family membrane protein insertase
MAYFQSLLLQLMEWFYTYTQSYGIAIILLTIFVKVLLLPFSFSQIKSMKKMQDIAPEQKRLQEKYKNDKEKLNTEIMKLYQENKINPAAGCLPLFIQFPFIIALFRVVQSYDFPKVQSPVFKRSGALPRNRLKELCDDFHRFFAADSYYSDTAFS